MGFKQLILVFLQIFLFTTKGSKKNIFMDLV